MKLLKIYSRYLGFSSGWKKTKYQMRNSLKAALGLAVL